MPHRVVQMSLACRNAQALAIGNGAPHFNIGEDNAVNGIRMVREEIKAAQLVLKSRKLDLHPALFDDAFPKRLQGTGE